MHPSSLVLAAVVLVSGIGAGWTTQPRVKVVVELFTSEGCSSCPPADALLRRLIREQPIEGVEIVALSEHVDYWDHQGWRDPFSSERFTERQDYYARLFDGNGMYTPQLIVDGRFQAVGSDWARIKDFLASAARAPKATVTVDVRAAAASRVDVTVAVRDVPAGIGDVDVMLALAQDGLSSDVKRGENARRQLHHDAVVRSLEKIGTVPREQDAGRFTRTVTVKPGWSTPPLRAVVFLQHRRSGHIVGAAAAAIVR